MLSDNPTLDDQSAVGFCENDNMSLAASHIKKSCHFGQQANKSRPLDCTAVQH